MGGREDTAVAGEPVMMALWPNVGIEPPYSVGSNDGLGVCPIDATILESK